MRFAFHQNEKIPSSHEWKIAAFCGTGDVSLNWLWDQTSMIRLKLFRARYVKVARYNRRRDDSSCAIQYPDFKIILTSESRKEISVFNKDNIEILCGRYIDPECRLELSYSYACFADAEFHLCFSHTWANMSLPLTEGASV